MQCQFNFKMRIVQSSKSIVVTPGITGEIFSCRRSAVFRSRAWCEIDILRQNNKSHMLLRVMMTIQ